eukprot:gene10805-20173_t
MSRVNAETLYLSTIIALMAAFTLRHQLVMRGDTFESLPAAGDDKICDDLEAFIVDNGGSIDGASCIYTAEGGGRGLVASSHLSYRSTYITVPKPIWFNEMNIKNRSD